MKDRTSSPSPDDPLIPAAAGLPKIQTCCLPGIFLTARKGRLRLVKMLANFGFQQAVELRGDDVFMKAQPVASPGMDLPPVEYARLFFPHVMDGPEIG